MAGRPRSRAKKESLEIQPSKDPDRGKGVHRAPGKIGGVDIEALPDPVTAQKNLELAHRALTLRKVGYDYFQIAKLMDLESPAAVEVLINRTLRDGMSKLTKEDVRYLDLTRLDRYEQLLNDAIESQPKMVIRAIEVAMQVMKRRSELLGLDAPQKHEIDSTKTTVVEYVRDPSQDEHKRKVAEIIDAEYDELPQLEETLRGLPGHQEDDQTPGSSDPGDEQ